MFTGMSSRGGSSPLQRVGIERPSSSCSTTLPQELKGFAKIMAQRPTGRMRWCKKPLSIFGERPIYLIQRKLVRVLGYLQSPEILVLI